MKSWPSPLVDPLASLPADPSPGPIRVRDTARGEVVELVLGRSVGMYVCGITPYDATHMGHAATYVTFDLLGRVLRDAGRELTYVQNVTDVDEPLLERANRDGIDWRDLAEREIQLFRDDMTALRVVPPEHYLGVVESMDVIEDAVLGLVDAEATYRLPVDDGDAGSEAASEAADIYLDLTIRPDFGTVSGWSRREMMAVFADRGGDPDRRGKRDPLDPLLWRAARKGEPSWSSDRLGAGRPGWHVECTAIAADRLGIPFEVQGGGSDLIFPHHEMSAVQATALCRCPAFAQAYVHQAMVGLDGAKMSKSKGNLVLVSRLREQGEDPMAIRLVLLGQRYRQPWDWRAELLEAARERLSLWRRACHAEWSGAADEDHAVVATIRERLRDDLDSPGALAAVDDWARRVLTAPSVTSGPAARRHDALDRPVARAVDSLLGVRL